MTVMLYDAGFAGFLTAVFEVFEYKFTEPLITRDDAHSGSLFGSLHKVITNKEKAGRVQARLKEKLSPNACKQLYDAWLSELKGMENVLLRYIQYALHSKLSVENDFSHPDVLFVQQTSRKVHREKHRMEAFVRFQLTKDELYYAIIQPDYNVLPLISRHFKDRYADQHWLIYDGLRRYGLHYDGDKVEEVQMEFSADLNNREQLGLVYDENEILFQELWKQYFTSVNIKARKNIKLHIQHMPKRYWRYLVEKQ
jgi:probable DNA metabolism protein